MIVVVLIPLLLLIGVVVGQAVAVGPTVTPWIKQNLDRQDKQELVQCIAEYHSCVVPLIVPITLLNHHFRRNHNEYIERSWYMKPYPAELSLTSSI